MRFKKSNRRCSGASLRGNLPDDDAVALLIVGAHEGREPEPDTDTDEEEDEVGTGGCGRFLAAGPVLWLVALSAVVVVVPRRNIRGSRVTICSCGASGSIDVAQVPVPVEEADDLSDKCTFSFSFSSISLEI